MIVRLFRRGGSCGYNDGCASTPKAVGNRLACALRAAGYQNSLAGEFIRVRGWFDQCIHFVSSDDTLHRALCSFGETRAFMNVMYSCSEVSRLAFTRGAMSAVAT